ncbi:MAG: ABC transporter permease [Clostridiales bacterium]|nr:ABC transporter permease [Clostridiales bacterium]
MAEKTATNPRESGVRHVIRRIFEVREIVILLLVALLAVFMGLNSRQFLTTANFRIVGNYMATDMIIGAFLTISLIAGNTDFSVGSNMGCSAFICGIMLNAKLPIPLCILGGLATGVAIGLLNGFIVVRLKVLPMIATMGTWMAFKGVGLMAINSSTLSNFPIAFKAIVQDWNVFGVSTLIVCMLVITLVAAFLLKYISFFHQAYFIGSNRDSARLSGINVKKFVYALYMLIGFFAAFAGVLSISRYGSAPASLGQGVEFRVISALLIGGVSLNGGEGSILGTFLGILLMALISNALTLFGVDTNLQNVLIGSIMVISVAIDEANRRRQG